MQQKQHGVKNSLDIYELKAFRVLNFKVFRDTGWIMVNRLTLLFGNGENEAAGT